MGGKGSQPPILGSEPAGPEPARPRRGQAGLGILVLSTPALHSQVTLIPVVCICIGKANYFYYLFYYLLYALLLFTWRFCLLLQVELFIAWYLCSV